MPSAEERPCLCPRPTALLEQALDKLRRFDVDPKAGEGIEHIIRQLSVRLRDRDYVCPVCLGSIKAGL
jgi:hypothetical protein